MQVLRLDFEFRIANLRRAQLRQDAARWRLVRRARRTRPERLFRAGCWLLCQVGHLLVQLGERMQDWGAARPVAMPQARNRS